MAKRKEEATAEVDAKTIATVIQVVQDITGCGRPEATKRVEGMEPATVARIAGLEAEGKRAAIVAILY